MSDMESDNSELSQKDTFRWNLKKVSIPKKKKKKKKKKPKIRVWSGWR